MQKFFARSLVALAVCAAAVSVAQAQVTVAQAKETSRAGLLKGWTPTRIAAGLLAQGSSATVTASAMLETRASSVCDMAGVLINAGLSAREAVSATLSAAGNGQAACILKSARDVASAQEADIVAAALQAGVDPTSVLPPTAAGPAANGVGTFVSPSTFGGGGGGRGAASSS